ncbi:hypothetical protein PHYPO_G00173100 [Pangasianodon hypophthalmus]|uniref:Uncharacterized protein n=1 Tax=Pangasianodon hypophthalmus TaxID=310915 RepID=A0A5N5JH33_PANHP|nr:hypothetical protein PHYPO_G00173100 [Pangasianodon hypophthalmus]
MGVPESGRDPSPQNPPRDSTRIYFVSPKIQTNKCISSFVYPGHRHLLSRCLPQIRMPPLTLEPQMGMKDHQPQPQTSPAIVASNRRRPKWMRWWISCV